DSALPVPNARTSQRDFAEVLARYRIYLPELLQILLGVPGELRIPSHLSGLRIEEQYVMRRPVPLRAVVRAGSLPDDLVLKVPALRAEHRVQDELEVVARVRVAMQVERAGGLEALVDLHDAERHAHEVREQT